jgi:S-adenosylmethionine decarboxylase
MALGNHLIVECHGCDSELLKDTFQLEELLKKSALTANATILHSFFHKFDQGEGVTGIIALAESHISIHTWPEHYYMAIDIFMCGECDPNISVNYIVDNVTMTHINKKLIERGVEYFSFYH